MNYSHFYSRPLQTTAIRRHRRTSLPADGISDTAQRYCHSVGRFYLRIRCALLSTFKMYTAYTATSRKTKWLFTGGRAVCFFLPDGGHEGNQRIRLRHLPLVCSARTRDVCLNVKPFSTGRDNPKKTLPDILYNAPPTDVYPTSEKARAAHQSSRHARGVRGQGTPKVFNALRIKPVPTDRSRSDNRPKNRERLQHASTGG